MWKKTLKGHQDFYLKCDAFLSADVFEKFRNNNLKNYGLYSSQFLDTPGSSCDTMLKKAKIKLELIPYPEMYIIFGKGKRVGIAYISNRYRKANNRYLKHFDPKQK